MRIALHFFTLIAMSLGLVGQAATAEFHAVRLAQYASQEKLLEAVPGHGPLSDLWFREKSGKYELLTGIFPEAHYAERLLARLRQDGRPGEIVPATAPESRQWLPQTHNISLGDLGYDRPVLLQGVQPYLALHFPWQDTSVAKGTVLRLDLRASQVLRQESTVTITVEGVPQLTLSAQELGQKPTVSVSLDAFAGQTIGATLDVEISGSLVASADRCLDMRNKGLWLEVDHGSALQVRQLEPPRSVRQFFTDPAARFTLETPGAESARLEAACRLAGLIGSLAHADRTRVRFGDYALSGHNIFLGAFADDARVLGSNLYVSPAGAALLASRWLPALIVPRLRGEARQDLAATDAMGISFEEMGYPTRTTRGTGDLTFSIDFTTIQLGGWPEKLLCTLYYTHTPVMEHNQTFVRVRMNGVLIESQELFGPGARRSLSFALPTQYFQAKNNLEIIFSSYHKTGDCMGSYPELEVSLLQDSLFTVTSTNPTPPLTLTSFPAVFTGKGAAVPGKSAEYVLPLVRLLELQGFYQQRVPDITITELANLTGGQFNYAVLAMDAQEAESLAPPLDLTHKLIVKNPLSDIKLLQLDTDESVTTAQTFYTAGKLPVLLYAQRHTQHSPCDTLTELLSSHPQGNVGIIHQQQWYSLEIGKKLRVIYPEKHDFAFYWLQYRLLFFALIGALILFGLLYLYHRLAKER